MNPTTRSTCVFRSLPAALLALAACQTAPSAPSAPQRAEVSDELTATAEVVGIDAVQRLVTLRREDGLSFDLYAGDEVRNFDQIAVGDVLRVRYEERLTASRRPAGESAEAMKGAMVAASAELGAKPGAGAGLAVSLRVRIESIDLKREIVVFSLASGELIAHRIATPEGLAFIEGLEIGDTVQLDYARGVAISVEEL